MLLALLQVQATKRFIADETFSQPFMISFTLYTFDSETVWFINKKTYRYIQIYLIDSMLVVTVIYRIYCNKQWGVGWALIRIFFHDHIVYMIKSRGRVFNGI